MAPLLGWATASIVLGLGSLLVSLTLGMFNYSFRFYHDLHDVMSAFEATVVSDDE